MSGHSKWHNIRLRKGKQDAERGALFTKLAREIILSSRSGGGDPDLNARLRLAMQKARENSMPQDRIKNAILKGIGEIEGGNLDELTYEGYGPGGAAIIVQCATDNRNRTVADVRSIFNKCGGNLGENGSVAWMFRGPLGMVTVPLDATDEDTLIAVALDAGAEDVQTADDVYEVMTTSGDLGRVSEAIASAGIAVASAEITMLPNTTVKLEGKEAQQMLRMVGALEDHDDVQQVHSNFDIPDDVLESIEP